jgi:hypothetical protein
VKPHPVIVLSLIALIICAVAYVRGYFPHQFRYGIDVENFGTDGVIILSLGTLRAFELQPYSTVSASGLMINNEVQVRGLEGIKRIAHLYPTIPSIYRDSTASLGHFPGSAHSLPDMLEVVWQLATLTECRAAITVESKSKRRELIRGGYDPAKHVRKRDCAWLPLPNRTFRRSVDLSDIKRSAAFRKTGRFNIDGGRHTFRLRLIFTDDQLHVRAENGATNAWR